MAKLIRAASLNGYVELARSIGLNSTRLLNAVDLDPAVLADPDQLIPIRVLVQLLELSASASGIEDFGLRLSELREFTNLGPMSLVARDEPLVRGALGIFIANLHLHNEALRIDIKEEAGQETLFAASGTWRATGDAPIDRARGRRALSYPHAASRLEMARRADRVRPRPSAQIDGPSPNIWRAHRVRPRLQRHRLLVP